MTRKPALKPAAFLSYVRFDDKHEDGKISELRERLSSEVRAQTGEEFPIFQDRNDILWGENWEQRIDQSLDASTFLIPIITPSFFKSPSCRKEVEHFLQRERKLRRNDLILPIYYIESSSAAEPEDSKRKDKIAERIFSRQYADWRELRFELITSPQSSKVLAQMAQQIHEATGRGALPAKTIKKRLSKKKRFRTVLDNSKKLEVRDLSAGTIDIEQATEAEQISPTSRPKGANPVSKIEPPTKIVDLMYRGDYTSISEAIQNVNPGDRILVRPGLYEEGIVLDKPLEIVGDGPPGEVVIRSTGQSTVLFKTTMGRLSNLKIQQVGQGRWFAIDVSQGRLEVEDCYISGDGLSCVAVHAGADPRFRRNRIYDGKQYGVIVFDNAQGSFEDNEIFGHALAVVAVKSGNPTFRRNRIHDAGEAGILLSDTGQGTFEDNEIFGNRLAGVMVKSGANPSVRRNRIHDGKQGGVLVYDAGSGTFENNDIYGNALAGIEVRNNGNPTVRENTIHHGKQSGLYINENGLGVFEKNDIFGNTRWGVSVRGGTPTLYSNKIRNNGFAGIGITEKGGGTYDQNDLRENVRGAWQISSDSLADVKRRQNIEK